MLRIKVVIFSFLSICIFFIIGKYIANNSPSNTSQLDYSEQLLANPVCKAFTKIADNIIWMSKQKSAEKIYDFEKISWLEQNLGHPTITGNEGSQVTTSWMCKGLNQHTITIINIQLTDAPTRGMEMAVICEPGQCSSYGFVRRGNKIGGSGGVTESSP